VTNVEIGARAGDEKMARGLFGAMNEGSLLRQTVLHVAAFVVGSLVFIGALSFVCVSAAKGLLPSSGSDTARGDTDMGAPKTNPAGRATPLKIPTGPVPTARMQPGKDG
jgi:hypothetical protein